MSITAAAEAVTTYWGAVRDTIPGAPEATPAAWAFGATAAHADGLLALVLAGTKTATAGAYDDYTVEGEAIPVPGDLSIILDGTGTPRAVIRTTHVDTVRFDAVTAAHAHAEGEGDRTLAAWRDIHERFWTEHALPGVTFSPTMLVVCERFELVTA